jgi:glycosyltransferase involved in cell wall biosynthesis
VVCTEILRQQLGWTSGQEIVAIDPSDPGDMAAAILALYRNENLWSTLREGALRRVQRDHAWPDFAQAVARALCAA